jgi:glycosyltransferase involved in cell wall biosynthesis
VNTPELSVIVPVSDRYDDVESLYRAYRDAIADLGCSAEIIYVLDGPQPQVLERLQNLRAAGEELEIVQLARRFGEATALAAGKEVSSGALILTLPAYFQVEPSALRRLFEAKNDHHMVIAHRWPRRGSAFEALRRRLFHRIIEAVTGLRYRDLGCGVRLLDRQVLDEVSLYGDQHRLLPVIVERNGFRVHEVDLPQSPHDEFRGRYSLRDLLGRLLDVFAVFFLVKFTKKPLRFFGAVGSAMCAFGGVYLSVIVAQRLFFGEPLADRPALLLSSLLVVLGIQIFGLGLLGELIIFSHARDLKEYRVERIVNDRRV